MSYAEEDYGYLDRCDECGRVDCICKEDDEELEP